MILHRGQVFEDLNRQITSVDLTGENLVEVIMISANGAPERAEDLGGVLRDALAEYWQTFFRKTTTSAGQDNLVPMLRHDFKNVWPAVARVIVLGFTKTGYFPIALSQTFMMHCIGEMHSESDMVSSFKATLSDYDKGVVEESDFGSEDFLDFLDTFHVKTVVTEANWANVLFETAHKTLIQEPAYIAECWRPVLVGAIDADKLRFLYTSLKPTVKKIIQALRFPDSMNAGQQSVSEFLKKFIKGSTDERLKRFLRFCTGIT